MAIDELDAKILALLERDARRSFAAIGREVKLSTAAVKRRVERLEADGTIRGFHADVDYGRRGTMLEAFTELRFGGKVGVDDISHEIAQYEEVTAVYTTAGDQDALVHLRVADVPDLRRVIDRLRRVPRVVGTKTTMVLATWRRDLD